MTTKTITQIQSLNNLGNAQVGDYFPANRGVGNTGTVNFAPTLSMDPSPSISGDITGNNHKISGLALVTNINNIQGYTATVTASGTTVLTVNSTYQQYFTGSLSQTVQLPVVSTLTLGQQYNIINSSSASISIVSSGSNVVIPLIPKTSAIVTCIALTGTTDASWSYQQFSSSTSVPGYTTTATAGGTTTLTVTSTTNQFFTGTLNQTLIMPVTSTLNLGQKYNIINSSTGVITIQSSGANTIYALPANSMASLTCILQSGTTAASWSNDGVSISNINANIPAFLITPSSANLLAALTTKTGTGNAVFATSPTLITPVLGVPASGDLSNCTALPVGSITGLGTGVSTFLATPSSANLLAALTTKTGTGNAVFATSPTLVTPVLGAASATSVAFTSTNGIIASGTNDNATVGSVGAYLSSVVLSSSPVSLTTNTNTTVTFFTLPAGDWDVWGNITFNGGSSTVVLITIGWLGTTAVTLPDSAMYSAQNYNSTTPFAVAPTGYCIPGYRISQSSSSTLILSCRASFTVSTCTAYGGLYARMRR